MTVTGQKKISIYDPATGTVVQLNNISEEGEFEKKGSFIRTSAGGRMYSGDESKAEFLSLEWTGYDQLVSWMKNRTPVRFVTYGLDEHILWYEDTLLTVDLKTVFSPYKRSGFKIYFEKAGGVHSIYKGSNILYALFGWQDSNSDGLADGLFSPATNTFTNEIQRFTIPITAIDIRFSLVYPIVGAELTFGANLISLDNNSIHQRVFIGSFANSSLYNIAFSHGAIQTFTTPAACYNINLYFVSDSVLSQTILEIKYPILSRTILQYSQIKY